MAITYVDYTATSGQTDFAFNFPYLEDEHVTVEINGAKQLSSDFSIVTSPATKVVLNVGATSGQNIRVRRRSQPDTNLVDFENGSVLTEAELDRAYLHNRYLAEEIGELNDASLQLEQGGTNWDGKNKRIKNVLDPQDPQDVSTKNYVDTRDDLKVSKTGDTMTGALVMSTNKVTSMGDPTELQDATTKFYVDNKITNYLQGTGETPVKYTFQGDGVDTVFTFSPGIILQPEVMYEVAINGLVQEPTTSGDPGAYTIDADANTITFTSPPANSSNIVVVLRGFTSPVVGAVGPQGVPGADGADGTDGAPGTPGADGADGADGTDGAPGTPGADGADGAPGADGADGADGTDGGFTYSGSTAATSVNITTSRNLISLSSVIGSNRSFVLLQVLGTSGCGNRNFFITPGDLTLDIGSTSATWGSGASGGWLGAGKSCLIATLTDTSGRIAVQSIAGDTTAAVTFNVLCYQNL